jgi:coniferyl-aldehyde dehydrogenase
LTDYVTNTHERNFRAIEINPTKKNVESSSNRKIPSTLIANLSDEASRMYNEILGPLLPIKTCQNFEDTITFINIKPRLHEAYYFGNDKPEEKRFLTGTTSAGVFINDFMFHIHQKDLPFSGVGSAGRAPTMVMRMSKPLATQKPFVDNPALINKA